MKALAEIPEVATIEEAGSSKGFRGESISQQSVDIDMM